MSDTIILMHGATLDEIANEARQHELLRELTGLETNDGKNYAIYNDPTFSPDKSLKILPFPSVGPTGSQTICSGHLKIGGNILKVTAYRNP